MQTLQQFKRIEDLRAGDIIIFVDQTHGYIQQVSPYGFSQTTISIIHEATYTKEDIENGNYPDDSYRQEPPAAGTKYNKMSTVTLQNSDMIITLKKI